MSKVIGCYLRHVTCVPGMISEGSESKNREHQISEVCEIKASGKLVDIRDQ